MIETASNRSMPMSACAGSHQRPDASCSADPLARTPRSGLRAPVAPQRSASNAMPTSRCGRTIVSARFGPLVRRVSAIARPATTPLRKWHTMKTGDRYILTAGEYSDYCIHAVVVALQDFNWDETVAAIEAAAGDNTYGFEHITDALIAQGFVKNDDAFTLHLGDYSRADANAESKMLRTIAEASRRDHA